MTVLADDRSIEKKDKTAGEPVQFYVKGSAHSAPYELVVFDVGKEPGNWISLHAEDRRRNRGSQQRNGTVRQRD